MTCKLRKIADKSSSHLFSEKVYKIHSEGAKEHQFLESRLSGKTVERTFFPPYNPGLELQKEKTRHWLKPREPTSFNLHCPTGYGLLNWSMLISLRTGSFILPLANIVCRSERQDTKHAPCPCFLRHILCDASPPGSKLEARALERVNIETVDNGI